MPKNAMGPINSNKNKQNNEIILIFHFNPKTHLKEKSLNSTLPIRVITSVIAKICKIQKVLNFAYFKSNYISWCKIVQNGKKVLILHDMSKKNSHISSCKLVYKCKLLQYPCKYAQYPSPPPSAFSSFVSHCFRVEWA